MKAAGLLRCVLPLLFGAYFGLAPCRADISDFSSFGSIEAEAQVAIRPNEDTFDPNPARDDDAPPRESDILDYNRSASAGAGKEGLTARGRAEGRGQVRVTANNLTFSASATTEATATRTGDPLKDDSTGAGGSYVFGANFRVDSRSRFTLSGNVSVQTNGSTGSSEAQVVLEGSTDDGRDVSFDFDAEDDPGDPRTIGISKSGFLEPGSYSVSVFTLSTIGSEQPSSRTSLRASFSVTSPAPTPPPDEGEDIRWTDSGGGSYFDPENWIPQRVPVQTQGRSDRVTFGLDRTYDVNLAGGPASCASLLLTNGSRVDMSGGALTVTGSSATDPSFVVTKEAQLTLSSGATLNTQNSLIGNDLNRLGEVLVSGSGRWNNAGRLTVGKGGDGSVVISNGGGMSTEAATLGSGRGKGSVVVSGEGSSWDSGELTVGLLSPSTVEIRTGASVNSSSAVIGLAGGDNADDGSVRVEGVSGEGAASSWLVTGLLGVGGSGVGILAVVDGAIVEADDLRAGGVGDGLGLIAVGGFRLSGERSTIRARTGTIGNRYNGSLFVVDGALAQFTGGPLVVGLQAFGGVDVSGREQTDGPTPELRFTDPTAVFSIGTGVGALGRLSIDSGGLVTVNCPRMEIGATDFGVGEVTIEGEGLGAASALVVTGTLQVGGATGGHGLLALNRGRVDVTGDINIFPNGIVAGIGRLGATGQINCDGTISAGLSPGILTIEGDLVLGASGTVQAEIGGLATGTEHDQLIVTGDATFGGKLVLQFMNGFAPQAGDQFNVVTITGSSSAFAEVQVAGLQPGAQFEVSTSDGTLKATALNDAVALPTVSVKSVGKKKKASEKGRKPGVFLISRSGGDKTAPLTVNYEIRGTAENGIDYLFLAGTTTIPAKKSAVALKVKPFDDKAREGPESILLKIIPGVDYSHSLQSEATVTVIDNERAPGSAPETSGTP